MSDIDNATEWIKRDGIIAILRGDFSGDDILRIGNALWAGSVTVMEITLNTPDALNVLSRLRQQANGEMLIGAGTVRDVNQARRAKEAGAQFLVSPNLDLESAAYARTSDLLHLPGVFTATEAQTAYAAGCRLLKLFPMEVVGPAYLRALRAPLNDIEFVPTGGISLENIAEYARAGAVAVGLGSRLIVNSEQTSADLTSRAKALRDAWEAGKHA